MAEKLAVPGGLGCRMNSMSLIGSPRSIARGSVGLPMGRPSLWFVGDDAARFLSKEFSRAGAKGRGGNVQQLVEELLFALVGSEHREVAEPESRSRSSFIGECGATPELRSRIVKLRAGGSRGLEPSDRIIDCRFDLFRPDPRGGLGLDREEAGIKSRSPFARGPNGEAAIHEGAIQARRRVLRRMPPSSAGGEQSAFPAQQDIEEHRRGGIRVVGGRRPPADLEVRGRPGSS